LDRKDRTVFKRAKPKKDKEPEHSTFANTDFVKKNTESGRALQDIHSKGYTNNIHTHIYSEESNREIA